MACCVKMPLVDTQNAAPVKVPLQLPLNVDEQHVILLSIGLQGSWVLPESVFQLSCNWRSPAAPTSNRSGGGKRQKMRSRGLSAWPMPGRNKKPH
mmetsp:Transcript_28260/g.46915  ORF Transcript_28260/g.46915 Transcript_28260/m.46915 type:complete len:95 (-) Transcript_28260:87-371(-)